jgi:hypothetical protein
METVDAHPKLRAALSDLLGPIYRRSTRNEIRVGAASPEHTDTLEWCSHGTSGYPSARVGRYPFPTELTGMGRNGSDYAIVTVAIYLQVSIRRARARSAAAAASLSVCLTTHWHAAPRLSMDLAASKQDHRENDHSLHTRPRSHRHTPRPFNRIPTHLPSLVLHPSIGDVVLFDSRLWHRGDFWAKDELWRSRVCARATALGMAVDNRSDASSGRGEEARERESPPANCHDDALHRQMMAFTYARPNIWSLHHDVCHAIRNEALSNSSKCRQAPLLTVERLAEGGCVEDTCGGGSETLRRRGAC